MSVVRKRLSSIVCIPLLLGITVLMLDFLSARLTFPVFSNRKRYGVTVMPTREEVLQIEAVQMEPARAHWQRCRLVPART
jgi:hypothetical protein